MEKKNVFRTFGIISFLLLIAITIASCTSSPSSNSSGPVKILTITNIPDISSLKMTVQLSPDVMNNQKAPTHLIDVNVSNSVTIPLNWSGTGDYYVLIWVPAFGGPPRYTTLKKISFQNENTSVDWREFITYNEWRAQR